MAVAPVGVQESRFNRLEGSLFLLSAISSLYLSTRITRRWAPSRRFVWLVPGIVSTLIPFALWGRSMFLRASGALSARVLGQVGDLIHSEVSREGDLACHPWSLRLIPRSSLMGRAQQAWCEIGSAMNICEEDCDALYTQEAARLLNQEMEAYAHRLEGALACYEEWLRVELRGGRRHVRRFREAQADLHRVHKMLSELRGRGLSWAQIEQRYAQLSRLFPDAPGFAPLCDAFEAVNGWSNLLLLEREVGVGVGRRCLPLPAIHHLLDQISSKEAISSRHREPLAQFVERANRATAQGRLTSGVFHRALHLIVHHSGKVKEPQDVPRRIGELINTLVNEFGLTVADQTDPQWRERALARGVLVMGQRYHIPEEPFAEVSGCRYYRTEDDVDLVVSWNVQSDLCRMLVRPQGRNPLLPTEIDPSGLCGIVPRTEPIASEMGRGWLEPALLVERLRNFLRRNQMPGGDLTQAFRVDDGGRVYVMTSERVPLDPVRIEELLLQISEPDTHEWLRASGVGKSAAAERYRAEVWSEVDGIRGSAGVDLLAQLRAFANEIAGSVEGASVEEVVKRLRAVVIPYWLREGGAIGNFSPSFLDRFRKEVEESFKLSTPNPSKKPDDPPTPSRRRKEDVLPQARY